MKRNTPLADNYKNNQDLYWAIDRAEKSLATNFVCEYKGAQLYGTIKRVIDCKEDCYDKQNPRVAVTYFNLASIDSEASEDFEASEEESVAEDVDVFIDADFRITNMQRCSACDRLVVYCNADPCETKGSRKCGFNGCNRTLRECVDDNCEGRVCVLVFVDVRKLKLKHRKSVANVRIFRRLMILKGKVRLRVYKKSAARVRIFQRLIRSKIGSTFNL